MVVSTYRREEKLRPSRTCVESLSRLPILKKDKLNLSKTIFLHQTTNSYCTYLNLRTWLTARAAA